MAVNGKAVAAVVAAQAATPLPLQALSPSFGAFHLRHAVKQRLALNPRSLAHPVAVAGTTAIRVGHPPCPLLCTAAQLRLPLACSSALVSKRRVSQTVQCKARRLEAAVVAEHLCL